MKHLLFLTVFFARLETSIGQTYFTKKIYFYEDTAFYIGCGVLTHSSVLYFTSDTSIKNNNKKAYNIVVECPELYGKDFFKKGIKYKVTLSTDYAKMGRYFSKTIFRKMRKEKQLYFCEKIEIE